MKRNRRLVRPWMILIVAIIFAAIFAGLMILGMAAQEWALGGEYASLVGARPL